MKDMTKLALRLCQGYTPQAKWDEIRDGLDLQTNGELDTFQLDLLTDMVRRLAQNNPPKHRRSLR